MYQNNIGSIIILQSTDEDESESVPTGIVTERYCQNSQIRINIFSNDANIWSNEQTIIDDDYEFSLKEAADLMQRNNIRRLPVLDSKGKLVGIVTAKDILKSTMDILKKILVEQDFMTLAF